MASILVQKCNLKGEVTWSYTGRVLERKENYILIEAAFNREDTPFHEILIKKGDLFIESYYSDRWYNIYEMHDIQDGQIKGWYCNVSQPAQIGQDSITFVDLALDLLVYPDGRQLVLDEDEYADLHLPPELDERARQGLTQLQEIFMRQFQA